MSLADHVTWFKLGRPRLGDVTIHKKNTYKFEEGAEVEKRLAAVFGPLHLVSAADLGCGPGESAIAKQILKIPWKRLVSVEAFIPYLNKLQTKDVAAERHDVFNGRIQDAFREYRPRELEVGLMIDVLEHFPRGEALNLLASAEKVFSRGFVIFVPLGEVEQAGGEGGPIADLAPEHRGAAIDEVVADVPGA